MLIFDALGSRPGFIPLMTMPSNFTRRGEAAQKSSVGRGLPSCLLCPSPRNGIRQMGRGSGGHQRHPLPLRPWPFATSSFRDFQNSWQGMLMPTKTVTEMTAAKCTHLHHKSISRTRI